MTPVHEAEPEPEDLPGPEARHLWSLFEPVHAVVYFAPEAREHFERAGLRGFWRGYFAGRAAPLGPVEAAPVTALFFSFAPALTTRALPASRLGASSCPTCLPSCCPGPVPACISRVRSVQRSPSQ